MKKLMKAVAAAAVALVASSSFATDQTKASFTNFDTGDLTVGGLVEKTDGGQTTGDKYWFAITNDSVAVTDNIGAIKNDSDVHGNYLAIEAQAPLYRTVNTSGDFGATLSATPQTIGDGIYLDTMVKFTVSSDEFKEGDLDTVDKLAITCYSLDDSGITNMLVRAGYVSGSSVIATNYSLGLPSDFDIDAWHRLTVRAIASVGSETAPVGFAIYLDQNLLTYSTEVAAGDSDYVGSLNAAVEQYLYKNGTHALLPSLVRTGEDKLNLSAVGFKGTGCLDDVVFTDEKPDFIVENNSVTIAWDDGVATYKVVDNKGAEFTETVSGAGSTNLTLAADITSLTVTATYAEGYEAGDWNGNFTVENGAKLDIVSMLPMFDVGGTHYGTFAEALAAAVASQTTATIKLMADYDEGDLTFSEGDIILDLAGCTLTGTTTATIVNGGANLIITNSTEEVGHILAAEDTEYAIIIGGGVTKIYGGSIDAAIDFDTEEETLTNLLELYGGFYLDSNSATTVEGFYLNAYAKDTVYYTGSDSYFQVGGEEPEPPLTGWAAVLGAAGEDGFYAIDNLEELKKFQQGVADGLETADESFKLTTDITLDVAWSGIGIQNGKDLANGTNETAFVDKATHIAEYDAGAFKGTFDGQNHTISGFQMVDGLDYCGFFNSIKDATIQNLKIAFKGDKFAVNTTSSTSESGATFVGVAKSSTLSNLTTLAGTVSCGKGFGGIVGYLMAGTTVESCTNNVNIKSLKSNKAGGIAMITQNGSGNAIVRNCVNNGTTAGNAKQKGGLIGYIGANTIIEDCTVTVDSEPTFFSWNTGTVTVTGVNKAPASVVPCKDTSGNLKTISGLTFATVDGNVATYVADNALALNGSYKVMGPSATATFEFAAAGTISFDTALATPTYAITAAEGLDLSSATSGTVTTYTATTQSTPVAPGSDDGETYNSAEAATNAAAKVVVAVPDAVKTAGVDTDTYAAMFEAKVVENNNGTYSVVVDLKPEVETAVQTAVDKATVDTLEDVLAADGASASVTVTTKAGLYYQIVTGNALPLAEPDSKNWTMAKGDSTSITVTKPAGNAAFFKVYCTPAK